MACCFLTAYCMNRLIRACQLLDLNIIDIQYNSFDGGAEDENANNVVATKISLEGLTCAACVTAVESAVKKLDGVERISVSLPLLRASVVHRPSKAAVKDIVSAIESSGYGARAGERTAQQNLEMLQHTAELEDLRQAFNHAAILSGTIYVLETVAKYRVPGENVLHLAAALLGSWTSTVEAYRIHRSAWQRALTMDTLVSLSLSLGLVWSLVNIAVFGLMDAQVYWSSGALLTMVIVGGRYLDTLLRKRGASSFAGLYELQEKTLWVPLHRSRRDSGVSLPKEDVVHAMMLVPGDEITINLQSIIPCDCYVLSGGSKVDQSIMTGETTLVSKSAGDFLLSGTQNMASPIVAVVSKPHEESALQQLIDSIAGASETSTQNSAADHLTKNFVRLILVLAMLTFARTMNIDANLACERAMAILASACPCALGLATPSAAMAGLDAARLRGVIVTGGMETLQRLSKLTHIVLDKTGTLTTGKLSVISDPKSFPTYQRIILGIAEKEYAQTHPVAQAIFQWALQSLTEDERRQVKLAKSNSSQEGRGISCSVELSQVSYEVHIGSARFLRETGVELRPSAEVLKAETRVFFAINGKYAGSLSLCDTVRDDAHAVIAQLRDTHRLNVAMLTGDVEQEAHRISAMLDIPVIASQTLPTEKKSFVDELRTQSSSHCVAMLGDGLNDTPALTAADVGIFLSSGSLKASIAAATNARASDVIFTSPTLSRLPELLEIARLTARQAKRNLWWALGYNTVAVTLAMGGLESWGLRINATAAGTVMALSSITVMGWSLLLRRNLAEVKFTPSMKRR